MPSLVAVELSGGRFVDALSRAWAAGDAVLPVDPRLPRPASLALLDALRPAWVVGPDGAGHRRAGARPTEPGDALVVATSGTTATTRPPRGVVLTRAAVEASALATSARLAVDPATDHWLACLPLAHVGGLSVVTRALLTGTGLTVHDRFDAAAVDAARQATLVSLVTAALLRVDPTRWRLIVLGGDAPPRSRPPNTVTTYGMTETGSGVVYDGRPLDGVEVRLAGGRGPGDEDEILLRAPMVGRAYRTAGGDVPLCDDDGWLHTGDAGHLDDDGRLVVSGRLGDLIVTGGENVWPAAVERVVRRHPAVAEVAVVGLPDPQWGQRVVAAVVVRAGHRPPGTDEVRDLVKAALPAYAAPREVFAVTELPRTALGKVRREALVRQLGA